MNFDLKERIFENGVVIEFKGEFDIFFLLILKDKFYLLIDILLSDVIIDMNDVSYIDLIGFGVFVGVLKKLK